MKMSSKLSRGQGLAEYALLLALIALLIIAVLALVGENVNEIFSHIADVFGEVSDYIAFAPEPTPDPPDPPPDCYGSFLLPVMVSLMGVMIGLTRLLPQRLSDDFQSVASD